MLQSTGGYVADDSADGQRNRRNALLLGESRRHKTDLHFSDVLVRRVDVSPRPHARIFVFNEGDVQVASVATLLSHFSSKLENRASISWNTSATTTIIDTMS